MQHSISSELPRGYRNNNPLNIRYSSANNWQGKVTPNTDGAFEQFTTMAYGYRAALYLIRKYISSGINTVAKVIAKWAPATENNTNDYIQRVCDTTGYTPTTILNSNNEAQLCNLVYAMAIVENGKTPMPDYDEIKDGWKLLTGSSSQKTRNTFAIIVAAVMSISFLASVLTTYKN